MLHVEFTVEPFVEGNPGPHVLAAVGAVEAHGAVVEFGPFGSSCDLPGERVGEIVASLLTAAYANGATHVTISVSPEAAL